MSITSAMVGSTEDIIIRSIVQEQRLSKAVVRPTVMDMSSEAGPGVKEIDLPRFSAALGAPSTQNPDGTTPAPFQTISLAVDALQLNQWKNLPYRLADRVSMQNRVNLEAELAKSAGTEMAIHLDTAIITEMATATQNIQYDNDTNTTLSVANINKAKATLKKRNVTDLDGELFLLISVAQEEAILNLPQFIEADKYGARDALLNGEVGKIFGFRVVVSNILTSAQSFAYHRSAVAFAAQKDVSYEKQRADVSLQAWDYSFSVGYGVKMLDAGQRIVKFSAAIDANLPA